VPFTACHHTQPTQPTNPHKQVGTCPPHQPGMRTTPSKATQNRPHSTINEYRRVIPTKIHYKDHQHSRRPPTRLSRATRHTQSVGRCSRPLFNTQTTRPPTARPVNRPAPARRRHQDHTHIHTCVMSQSSTVCQIRTPSTPHRFPHPHPPQGETQVVLRHRAPTIRRFIDDSTSEHHQCRPDGC
jgi:hypothetical protein